MNKIVFILLFLSSISINSYIYSDTTQNISQEDYLDEYDKNLKEVILELFDIGAIQLGSYKLKSGITSPYYIDLRKAISRPELLGKMSDLIWKKISSIECDELCAVPYASISLTTAISLKWGKPMIMLRKESKDHGTKKLIEGIFKSQDEVILVDDVLTSGISIEKAAQTLINEGLIVKNAVIFLDRENKGIENLEKMGVKVHKVLNISTLFSILTQYDLISPEELYPKKEMALETLSYYKRAELTEHPLAKELLYLMEEKKTNLAASADISNKEELLNFANIVGPYICILKTHIDIIEDFDEKFILELKNLSRKHRFFIFEDRKFADIGNTVSNQYKGGIYKIASWANLINAHTFPGQGVIEALKMVNRPIHTGLILIPQMSTSDAFFDNTYIQKTLEIAQNNKDFVIGFIAKGRLNNNPNFIYFTPGIHLDAKSDQYNQNYQTPYEAITLNGSDIIIVGRGLYKAKDPEITAKQYQSAGWNTYLQRLKQ